MQKVALEFTNAQGIPGDVTFSMDHLVSIQRLNSRLYTIRLSTGFQFDVNPDIAMQLDAAWDKCAKESGGNSIVIKERDPVKPTRISKDIPVAG